MTHAESSEHDHRCHFCGTELRCDSTEFSGARHYLSDCRPDLIGVDYGGGLNGRFKDGPMV